MIQNPLRNLLTTRHPRSHRRFLLPLLILPPLVLLPLSAPAQYTELRIDNPQAGVEPHNLGQASAIDGPTLVLGAPRSDADNTLGPGLARIYRQDNQGNWIVEARLASPNSSSNTEFGIAVAASGETVVIGASAEDSREGAIASRW